MVVRLYLWKPWRTLTTPLVWILHAAYAWIVVHLALRGLFALELLAGSYATHALTVGAIGGLTLGMLTRTTRGHTGRPLIADGFEISVFLQQPNSHPPRQSHHHAVFGTVPSYGGYSIDMAPPGTHTITTNIHVQCGGVVAME